MKLTSLKLKLVLKYVSVHYLYHVLPQSIESYEKDFPILYVVDFQSKILQIDA